MGNYNLKSGDAIVKVRKTKEWSTVDISKVATRDLFAIYQYITVGLVDLFQEEHTLHLAKYETELRHYDKPLQEWLNSIGDRALDTTEGLPTLAVTEAQYWPMMFKQGDFQLTMTMEHPSHSVSLDDCRDLVAKYDGVDMEQLDKSSLWSIDGYFMESNYSNGYIRIPEAGEVIKRAERYSAGFIDFGNIGDVTTLPITPDMVYKIDTSLTYRSRIMIKTNFHLYDKTVGIVIGGYLHLLDGVVNVISDNVISISLNDMELINRWIESKDTLDLSFLGLDDIREGVNVSDVLTDDKLEKYITSIYSFIVIINNPNIYTKETSVDSIAAPNVVIQDATTKPARLVTHSGRGVDYWYTVEAGQRCMQHEGDADEQFLLHYSAWEQQGKINNARIGKKTHVRKRMHELRIFGKV